MFFSEPQGPRQRAKDALLKLCQRQARGMASSDEVLDAAAKYAEATSEGAPLDEYQTEDFNFIYRAKEAGLGCWMYVNAQLAHQGSWVFEGNLSKVLEHQKKTQEKAA